MKKFFVFTAFFIFLSSTIASSQTPVTRDFTISVQSRVVPSNWWISIPMYMYGDPGRPIEGLDVVINYQLPIEHQYGEYIGTWSFPSDWWCTGGYVSPAADTLRFAMLGEPFSFSSVFLGYFPVYVGGIAEGQTVRLNISAYVAEKIAGRDTLIQVSYKGGYITGCSSVLAGDADNDGAYSILDPLRILDIATGQYAASMMDSVRCDVSGDGYISSYDAYEVLMRVVYPYWTFEVLQGNYGGAKGNTVPVPGTETPISIQLTDVEGGVQVSLPDSVSINCADLSFSSPLTIDKNVSTNGLFASSADSKRISLIATSEKISGKIGFVSGVSAKDLIVTGTVGNGTRITVVKNIVTSVSDHSTAVKDFSLAQNYPNPFNPTTMISYSLPKAGNVTLKVYDMLGREVAALVNGVVPAGQHEVQFDASFLPSGTYLYRLEAGSFTKTQKMLLLK